MLGMNPFANGVDVVVVVVVVVERNQVHRVRMMNESMMNIY